MKKIIISFLFLASILYLSCSEENNPVDGGSQNNFIPIKVGAFWLYHYEDEGVISEIKHEVTSKDSNGFYSIWFTIYFLSSSGDTLFIHGAYNRLITNEGIMEYDRFKQNGKYILKKPYKKGTTWENQLNDSTAEKFSIVDEDVTYTTPARTFRGCIKVNYWIENYSDSVEYIYAPNVGCIKYYDFILKSYFIP